MSQTNNVHITRSIPSNAALILNDKNDLSGIEADPDVEENLEAVRQRLLIDSMEIPNIHEYTMFTFYSSDEMASHFHGDYTFFGDTSKFPHTNYITDNSLSNPIVVLDKFRHNAIKRVHKTMNELEQAMSK